MRAGELNAIFQPAEAYFGRFSDLSRDLAPSDRVAEWLGEALRDDALVGFEATLHRPDLPTMAEIAEGFAQNTVYNYSYPLMAGLYERLCSGKGFDDLPEPILLTGLLLSYSDRGWKLKDEKEVLQKVLVARVGQAEFGFCGLQPVSLRAGLFKSSFGGRDGLAAGVTLFLILKFGEAPLGNGTAVQFLAQGGDLLGQTLLLRGQTVARV